MPCAPEQSETVRYQETLDQIIYAEELGFDTAWLAELHFYRSFSIMPAPLMVATAIAQRTQRIRLGTAVNLLPFHHPLRAAAVTYEQIEETMSVFGNPDECIARITEVQQETAIDQLICWFNPGGLVPQRQVITAMERFAKEVMPAVRSL